MSTGGTFSELQQRIGELVVRVAATPPDAPAVLSRDELLDVLDAVERLGRAIETLQQKGRFR
jgi:hypothetical protein